MKLIFSISDNLLTINVLNDTILRKKMSLLTCGNDQTLICQQTCKDYHLTSEEKGESHSRQPTENVLKVVLKYSTGNQSGILQVILRIIK